ncbi:MULTISPECIES: hypothetical protein [Natrialbaceae]|uniref:hypothetical protein n=1 Tax=Natrialbaceae TaxID=1644061 RepID=UPI00207D0897|nr:hypothetical protein [Natronococcus sp. CG52]
MRTGLLVALLVVALAGTAFLVRYELSSPNRGPLMDEIDGRLAETLPPGRGSHLEQAPTVRRLAVSAERDGESVYIPVIRIEFGTTDAPGTRIVFEYVADVLEAIHPVFEARDERVAHYDVEFRFGPDGLLVDGECRRVSVPIEFADELLENDSYRAFDLWRDVERGDGDETVTTLWGACRSGSRFGATRQVDADSPRSE